MISGAEIRNILAMLNELPELPEQDRMHTNKEAVQKLKPAITALRKKGYTLQQIVERLADTQLKISASTLKSYVAPNKATQKSAATPRKSRRKPPVQVTASPEKSNESATPESSTFKVADDRPIGEL